MVHTDYQRFCKALIACAELHGRTLSEGALTLWWRALEAYPIEHIERAFFAAIRDPESGRYMPKPADIIRAIEGYSADDGRPGAEEAWSIAAQAFDESATVVWTPEIAQAFGIARPILRDLGDEVGARMAFKEAYTRIVAELRRRGETPAWSATLGFDVDARAMAIREAVERGRLPASELVALPAPKDDVSTIVMLSAACSGDSLAAREAKKALAGLRSTAPNEPAIDANAADAQMRETSKRIDEAMQAVRRGTLQ